MTEAEDVGPSLLREEIEQALEEMKKGKAEGIDNIPADNNNNGLFHICSAMAGFNR